MGRPKSSRLMEEIKMAGAKSLGAHFDAFIYRNDNIPKEFYLYESARACLFAFLQQTKPNKIYIPNYICSAVTDAVELSGVEVARYGINNSFVPEEKITLKANDFVLVVNYFGLQSKAVGWFYENHPARQLIIDCSQAFFYADDQPSAKIYSPRKFLPVADGGIIKSPVPLKSCEAEESASIRRYQYLLGRVAAEPESTRESYLQAESELGNISLRRMSEFTRGIINSQDYDLIKKRRVDNFNQLAELNKINKIKLDAEGCTPLCYPLMIEGGENIRMKLIEKRVFTPKYWPDVLPVNNFEKKLTTETIFLPIDHRYGLGEMNFLVDLILKLYQGDVR